MLKAYLNSSPTQPRPLSQAFTIVNELERMRSPISLSQSASFLLFKSTSWYGTLPVLLLKCLEEGASFSRIFLDAFR